MEWNNRPVDKNGVTIHITYDRIHSDDALKDAVIRVIELLGRYWEKPRKKPRVKKARHS